MKEEGKGNNIQSFYLQYDSSSPRCFLQPITDEQIKRLKQLRRKLRNKASARKSRDQDKERVTQMETDFLTKAVSCLAEVLCKSLVRLQRTLLQAHRGVLCRAIRRWSERSTDHLPTPWEAHSHHASKIIR